MLSCVIPTYNKNLFLKNTLKQLIFLVFLSFLALLHCSFKICFNCSFCSNLCFQVLLKPLLNFFAPNCRFSPSLKHFVILKFFFVSAFSSTRCSSNSSKIAFVFLEFSLYFFIQNFLETIFISRQIFLTPIVVSVSLLFFKCCLINSSKIFFCFSKIFLYPFLSQNFCLAS